MLNINVDDAIATYSSRRCWFQNINSINKTKAMTKKDMSTNENTDREKDRRIDEDWKSHHTTGDRYPEEAKGIGETDVKNASATGDGSYGRSDGSLPDGEDGDENRSTGSAY